MDGWYLGGQIGYDTFRTANIIDTPATSPLVSHPRLGANGWSGGILLGYGSMFNSWLYFGGEIFADTSNFSQSLGVTTPPGTTYTNIFTSQSMIGLGFLPGIKMTDSTLTFAKLGWNRAVIKVDETSTGAISATRSNDSNGLVLGFGIETLITDHWSLRTEFDHISLNYFYTPVPYSTKIDPADNQFMFGLVYHFTKGQITQVTG
jgi:opacity protein-like surface antigen